MTASALVSGALCKPPEQRQSKAGKPFVTATLQVGDGNTTNYWQLLAFAEAAQAELMRLGAGDRLSAQGRLQLELYSTRDGQTKISRTILTDHVLALRQPRHARQPTQPDGAPSAWDDPNYARSVIDEAEAGP